MKTSYIFTIVGITSFVIVVVYFMSIQNYITVKTDWSSYANYSPITISGQVAPIQDISSVFIQIFYPNGEIYNSSKVTLISNSNLYSYQFKINTPMQIGTYDFTVKATYAGHSATTSFQYVYSLAPGMKLPNLSSTN